MRAFVNFVIVCVFLPGLYAVGTYWYSSHLPQQKATPLAIALLISTPLLLTGIRDWWDIWVLPFPKLGSPFQKLDQTDYYVTILRLHGLALVICLVFHLWTNSQIAERKFRPSTLDVPRTKARIGRFERLIAAEKQEWTNVYTDELSKFPEVKEEGLPLHTHENLIDDFIEERDKLVKQLEYHEKKVKFLANNPTETSDTFTPRVLICLFFAAVSGSLAEPMKKRFDSGDPIERA